MNRSILLLCLLTSGCGMSPVWHVDERFSPEEQAQIQRGADTWPVPIDLLFNQRVSSFDTDRRVVVRVPDRHTLEVASELARKNPIVKTVTIDETRILVLPEAYAPMWYRVAHEFGHGLGIKEHVSDPDAIMYHLSSPDSRGCVTQADADALYEATGDRIRVGCPDRD
jgi:hypothetical protein